MGVNEATAHIGVQRRPADAQAGGGGFGGEKAVLGHGRRVFILINFINIDYA
jgi:hypothetical protein